MFFLSFLTFLKVTHLAGLILGFGGAILTDFTILTRGVLRPVSPYAVRQTEFLSKIVSLGLAILWISGIALIWHNLALHPEYLTNQKLWAKIAIVIMLTFNGVLIHKIILPMLHTAIGRRLFESVPVRKILGMTLLGAISLVSWSIPRSRQSFGIELRNAGGNDFVGLCLLRCSGMAWHVCCHEQCLPHSGFRPAYHGSSSTTP